MYSTLHQISNTELLSRMEKLVRTERKITHLVLLHICEIEERRLYAEKGFDGMYSYLTRGLGYSEAAAYRRLQSTRLLKQIPEVAEKVQVGALNLSQLTQVQKCLKASNQSSASATTPLQVLEKIENKNSFETQSILAQEFNLPVKSEEVLRPQKDQSLRLEITLTAEQFNELQKAKNLLSHSLPEGRFAEVIGFLAKDFTQRKMGRNKSQPEILKQNNPAKNLRKERGDEKNKQTTYPQIETDGHEQYALPHPLMRSASAKRFKASLQQNLFQPQPEQKPQTCKIQKSPSRKYISVHTRKEVFKRAHYCCEYVDPSSGRACRSTYQLQVEHIVPVAHCGGDEIHNLKALCRTHNLLMAEKLELPKQKPRLT